MEFLGLVFLVALIWYGLSKMGRSSARRAPPADARPEAIDIPLRISVTTSYGSGEPDKIDTGTMGEVPNGYILNPRSPLPLSLLGLSRERTLALKSKLDVAWIEHGVIEETALLFAKENLRCPEIEAFSSELKRAVDLEVERQRASSPEWASASEKDREDLLAMFTEAAIDKLPTRPGRMRELGALLAGPPEDATVDDALLARFGVDADAYKSYMYLAAGARVVRSVPADDYYRKRFELFAAQGLARRGLDIPMPDILSSLRLKDLNGFLKGTVAKPVGRKAKAIELVLTLPDLKDRLSKTMSFRELFQILPPEGMDVDAIARSFAWASAVAQLLCYTYSAGNRSLRTISERGDYGSRRFKVMAGECCASCTPLDGKTYKSRPTKLPPYHLGCSCWLEGVYD